MFSIIDNFLNRITMYRLVLYYLLALLGTGALLGFFGILPYNPATLAFSTLLILGVCRVANIIFAKAFDATANVESVYITGLILALIITPAVFTDYAGIGFIIFASTWAMASKYIFAVGKKHIFNPAAFGVALSSLLINQSAIWWVGGNLFLLPVVFFGGLLIVRKIRRFDLVLSFVAVTLAIASATTTSGNYLAPITQTLLHSPIFFFAFVMLTEPLTMPPNRWSRIVYGALVGLLFAPNVHLGSFYLTPELALLAGNLFACFASPKGRFMLKLVERKKLAVGVHEFVFVPDRPFRFRPGQYLEWTLGHRFADNRGNRRYFTIASSPTENKVRLGVKFYEPASSFKRALGAMKVNEIISASQLAGNFVLPKNPQRKLAFIAGGIGVTPFRSMAQYLIDKKEIRSIVLFYANKTVAEISYKDVFDRAAEEVGFKTVYTLNNEPAKIPGMYSGQIDGALIAREIPDYKERAFFISGPHSMVESFKKTLRGMGIPFWRVKSDYFPGFV